MDLPLHSKVIKRPVLCVTVTVTVNLHGFRIVKSKHISNSFIVTFINTSCDSDSAGSESATD